MVVVVVVVVAVVVEVVVSGIGRAGMGPIQD